MKITSSKLKQIIKEEVRQALRENKQNEKSFDIDVFGSTISTAIKFISTKTNYDQTITNLQIMPDGEAFEDVEFYGREVDDLADEVISYLDPDTSNNFDYWFLDEDNPELKQEFKANVIKTLEAIGATGATEADDAARTSYREREHNSDFNMDNM